FQVPPCKGPGITDAPPGIPAGRRKATLGSGDRGVDVLRQSGLGSLAESGEGSEVADGQLGEDLAVDIDLSQAQAVDETVVGDVVHASGSVDALDPQLAELRLASATVAVGVGHGVQPLLLGLTVKAGALAAVALGGLQDCATLLLGVDGPLDTCHGDTS